MLIILFKLLISNSDWLSIQCSMQCNDIIKTGCNAMPSVGLKQTVTSGRSIDRHFFYKNCFGGGAFMNVRIQPKLQLADSSN